MGDSAFRKIQEGLYEAQARVATGREYQACNCIGPRNGEPLCRCMMASCVKVPGLGLVRVIVPEKAGE